MTPEEQHAWREADAAYAARGRGVHRVPFVGTLPPQVSALLTACSHRAHLNRDVMAFLHRHGAPNA